MVLVGRVTRPHGLRGHVVVAPDTDFAEERFRTGGVVWLFRQGEAVPVTLESVRFHGLKPIVRFDGVASISEAEGFVGQELRVPLEALCALPDGAWYHHDIVGCRVDTTDGTPIGQVLRVDGGAAGSVLVVEGPSGEVLIPFVTSICVAIDVPGRSIRVNPPDGLLELNQRVAVRARRRGRRPRGTKEA